MQEEAQQDEKTDQATSGNDWSSRSIFWILVGLVAAGAAVVYKWWRGLPR